MPVSHNPESQDVEWVRRIMGGDGAAWNTFVDRFTDRVWKRAWTLCDEACPFNKNHVFCVFHALAKDAVQPVGDDRPGCDEGLEIYAYIFDYFHNKHKGTGKLKHYDGRSKLDTFVTAVLHGNLRTDWIRHKRKLRVDQITRPAEIQRLSESDGRVFEQMVMQRTTEAIATNLSLTFEGAQAAQERVTHALMANGNLHIILRNPESGLEDFDLENHEANPRVLPLKRSVDAIWDAVCDLIAERPENEKILLTMVFDRELDAQLILDRCSKLGVELPVKPRSGKTTIHSIYQSVDSILKVIGEGLQERHAALLSDAYNWLDDDGVSTTVSVKGLKALLKNMGLSRPPAAGLTGTGTES